MRRLLNRSLRRGGVGVAFGHSSTALGRIARRSRCSCDVITGTESRDMLDQAVIRGHLKGMAATLVLGSDDYRLVLVEPPDVPEDELAQACRWRIRDLIDFPVADAVVEVFDAGEPRRRDGTRIVYAVAAHREAIRERLRQAHDAGLRTHTVGIPELALRNVAAALSMAENGVALLHLDPEGSRILLVREDRLYLTRSLGFSLEQPLTAETVADVALELQRSLDYYDSHFRVPPVRTLAVLGTRWLGETALSRLSEELSLEVAWVGIQDLFPDSAPGSPETFDGCAVALGAALGRPA